MKKFILLVFISLMMVMGCDQYITRQIGGTTTIQLEPNQKLVEATWKESNLWYLTEPMDSDYKPKTRVFQESSVLGVMEGKVIFIETKKIS